MGLQFSSDVYRDYFKAYIYQVVYTETGSGVPLAPPLLQAGRTSGGGIHRRVRIELLVPGRSGIRLSAPNHSRCPALGGR